VLASLGLSIVVQKSLEALFSSNKTAFVLTLNHLVLLKNKHGAIGWFS